MASFSQPTFRFPNMPFKLSPGDLHISQFLAPMATLAGFDVVVALALDPTNSSILYAATNPRGVWRSADGGASWAPGAKPLTEHLQAIAVDPHTPTHVYLGTRAGVFRSIDSGDNFEPAGLAWSNSVWTLVFDSRTKPATLYYGGVGGVLKTVDGGQWWNVTGPIRP